MRRLPRLISLFIPSEKLLERSHFCNGKSFISAVDFSNLSWKREARGLETKMGKIPAMALVLGLLFGQSVGFAKPSTFSFKGTLASAINGNKSVVGEFTLDPSLPDPNTGAPGSITAFNFSAGVGTIDSLRYRPLLFVFTPAAAPNTNFVMLEFAEVPCCKFLQLIFQTDLSSFSVSSLFTGNVNTGGTVGTLISQLNDGVRTLFTSVSTNAGGPAEPSSLVMLVVGLLTLLLLRHRFRPVGPT